MKVLPLIAGGMVLFATNAAFAQPTPPAHARHHAVAKKTAAAKRCCCEGEMREMMSMMHQMMKMHGMKMQGGMMKQEGMNLPEEKGMTMPMSPTPSQPAPDQHQP